MTFRMLVFALLIHMWLQTRYSPYRIVQDSSSQIDTRFSATGRR